MRLLHLLLVVVCWGCRDDRPTGMPTRERGPGVGQLPTSSSELSFRDRTSESGVRFRYENGESENRFAILESMGGGGGLFDFDRDGRMDLLIAGGGTYAGPRTLSGRQQGLFRQSANWRWVRNPEGFTLPFHDVYTHGITAGDFDADGFPDAVVTGYGRISLARNLGDGTFEQDHAERIVDPSWGTSAAWGDVDRDGDLDLFVTHYVNWSFDNDPVCEIPPPHGRDVCPPRRFEGLADALFLNDGAGSFSDGAQAWGLRPDGKGIGVVMSDLDLDGDLDVYVSNDTVPNFLYVNQGDRFEEAGMLRGVALSDEATADGSMGVDVADADLDGLPDIWVTNYQREIFALYRNVGEANFQHGSRLLGIAALGPTHVGWGTVFIDPDRDGDEDLVVTNGHVVHHPVGSTVAQKPMLLENREGRRFVNVADAAGEFFQAEHRGRGLACGDLDNDGDPDLVFVPVKENVSLLENTSGEGRNWISLQLIGTQSSRHPIGATVEVRCGTVTRLRQVKGGGSYASTNGEALFAGLADADIVDEITIRWPSGRTSSLKNLPGRRRLAIVEPLPDSATFARALPGPRE